MSQEEISNRFKINIKDNVLQQEIRRLRQINKLKEDDKHYKVFINKILPSCLFRWHVNGRDTHKYVCPFKDCYQVSSETRYAKRHMREQHYNDIPEGVFNTNYNEMCKTCEAGPFLRKEHLKSHLQSRSHLNKMIENETASIFEREKFKSIRYGDEQYKFFLEELTKEKEEDEALILLASEKSDIKSGKRKSDQRDNSDKENDFSMSQSKIAKASTSQDGDQSINSSKPQTQSVDTSLLSLEIDSGQLDPLKLLGLGRKSTQVNKLIEKRK